MSRYWGRVRLGGESETLTTRDRKPRISRISRIGLLCSSAPTRFLRKSFCSNTDHFIRGHPSYPWFNFLKTIQETTDFTDITDWAFILTAHHTLPAQVLVLVYESSYPWSSELSVV